MELTIGPLQFFWTAEARAAFYDAAETMPVDRIVLGEAVCSKRSPFVDPEVPERRARLEAAGKAVAVTSLALITLKRERKLSAALAAGAAEVEINDLTMLAYLPEGAAFSVGPLVNVFNEGTLRALAARGMRRICLPPELPLSSIRPIAAAAAALGVTVEVWAWGRAPLAIAGRCYHARLHGRGKDDCRFVCDEDADGRDLEDLDGRAFLAVNGVQTLSHGYVAIPRHLDALREAGVGALRLSPHSGDFGAVAAAFRAQIEGRASATETLAALRTAAPDRRLVDGFLDGVEGARPAEAVA
jgi:collagenase-like PrtC family protease